MSATPAGILVGVDGSPESEAALRWAITAALLHDQPVTLLYAIAPVVVTWPVAYLEADYADAQQKAAQQVLEQAQQVVEPSAGAAQPPAVKTEVVHQSAASALVAGSRDAYMTVVGSRGLGVVGRAFLGSVSSGLVHHGHGPVAVVHKEGAQTPDRTSPILLGSDGSPASEAATALAFDEASRRGVELVALHAWSDVGVFPVLGMDWHEYEDEGREVLAERLAGWQERYPDVHVQRRIVSDQPARWLIDASQQAQLVVVGSRGRGGFTGMVLGSVAAKVSRGAHAPVIVVRPR